MRHAIRPAFAAGYTQALCHLMRAALACFRTIGSHSDYHGRDYTVFWPLRNAVQKLAR